jgi:hypothetical protein
VTTSRKCRRCIYGTAAMVNVKEHSGSTPGVYGHYLLWLISCKGTFLCMNVNESVGPA